MAVRRPLIAGNWKMNGLAAQSSEITAICAWAEGQGSRLAADLLVCPPATLLMHLAPRMSGGVALGAQNCHVERSGAFTGEVSAEMLVDAGARYIIAGHSERRAGFGERDADVKAKAHAVHAAGACAIICIGETSGERRFGLTLEVIGRQLRRSISAGANAGNTVIAYEPVWAIGAGMTPDGAEIADAHGFIRAELHKLFGAQQADAMRILYGGSVKPSNAAEIFRISNVDGALVGGASLKSQDFTAIASAYLS